MSRGPTDLYAAPRAGDSNAGPVRPPYGHGTLADLLPSLGAHLGVPGCQDDVLGLPNSRRYVVVVIDGLGWHLLRGAVQTIPYLAGLLGDARPLTCAVPSTTATSLTCLGTGLPPGGHGVVGFTSRVPQTGEILNALTWEIALDPRGYQPRPTLFERAAAAGVAVSSVARARFEGSGLTTAALRGARFVPFGREDDLVTRIELVRQAAAVGSRSLVYAYESELDHVGHARGAGSPDWLAQLARVDDLCEQLREALPPEVTLVITGDHGMVDVPPDHRLVVEDEPELLTGVAAVAGEARFRQLYLIEGAPVGRAAAAVAARWAARLGDRAWVQTREAAIAAGWFGPVEPEIAPRYGDVLVALRGDWAVLTRTMPKEMRLVGMHGSLTPEEMTIPLLCD